MKVKNKRFDASNTVALFTCNQQCFTVSEVTAD